MHALCESAGLVNPEKLAADTPNWLYDLAWFAGHQSNPPEWIRSCCNHHRYLTADQLPLFGKHNVAPDVRMLQPLDGAEIGASVELQAVAADRKGNLKNVAFYLLPGPWKDWTVRDPLDVDGALATATKLGEARPNSAGQYAFTRNNIKPGFYDLAAVAWDADGKKMWVRKVVDVPADKAGKYASIGFGGYSEDVTVYFNNQELKPAWARPPRFFNWWAYFNIPPGVVKAGRNVLALRVHSLTENGLVWALPKNIVNFANQATTDDTWRYAVETRFPDLTPEAHAALPKAPEAKMENTASALFNGKIHPLIPYAIRGAIWYQGESNASRGSRYAPLLTAMIADWRARWGQGDFPFYIVQLANYYQVPKEPGNSGEAEVREGQLQVSQTVPNTGLAVTIDIGEENIHPRNKLDVGHRLALHALAKTYGRNTLPCSGPIYRAMAVEGQSIRISFDHLEGGLIAKGGPLKRFAIAGDDKKFVWADAKIEGETVLVSSPQVPAPVAVRYAWATNPEGCNLSAL